MMMMMMIKNDNKNVDDDEYKSKAQEKISFWQSNHNNITKN